MELYLVKAQNDETDMTVGVATTEEKAQQMVDALEKMNYFANFSVDGFENLEYNYYKITPDTLELDAKTKIEF